MISATIPRWAVEGGGEGGEEKKGVEGGGLETEGRKSWWRTRMGFPEHLNAI